MSESRIVADDTDDADFRYFCLLSVFGEADGGCVLRSEDANWKVCATKERADRDREVVPTEEGQSGIGGQL